MAGGILDGLNRGQREAVVHDAGPLLIVAGAGTGKTTVITRRIAHLITEGKARPHEILALTFTDKAAAEMEERVDQLVPYGYADVEIATFHAFGDSLLRGHSLKIGLENDFSVLSRAEQVIFLWRGAAISNVLGFLDRYPDARQIVITENFRSHQAVLDAAYTLIVYNNPDRLEVRSGIDKRLVAVRETPGPEPRHLHYETATQEADAVAQLIRERVEQGQ